MPCQNPIPLSYVRDPKATTRISNYITNKWPLLSKWIKDHQGTPEAANEETGFSYTTGQFALLANILNANGISGLRIYFASYTKDGSTDNYIPAGKEDLMTLIFAPTKPRGDGVNHDDIGGYYILDPTSNTPTPINITAYVTNGIKNFSWVKYYNSVNGKRDTLSEVATNTPENGETISMWYDIKSITDWNNEISCWEINGQTISKIQFALAAYSEDDPATYNATNYAVDYQLTLIITIDPDDAAIADRSFAHYNNMENFQLFKDRLEQVAPVGVVPAGGGGGGYDTGVPCPPAVCG